MMDSFLFSVVVGEDVLIAVTDVPDSARIVGAFNIPVDLDTVAFDGLG